MVDETNVPALASGGRRARSIEIVLFGLVATVTVLLAIALAIRLDDSRSDPVAKSRSQALTAGATGAAALLSYDYRTIGQLVATNRPLLTPVCSTGYTGQVSNEIKAEVTKNQVVLTATVRAVAVESIEAGRASVLVIVDEKRVGNDRATEQTSQLAVSISLVLNGRTWLVDDLVPAGSLPAAGSVSGATGTSRHCV
jgi:hypothetical protein